MIPANRGPNGIGPLTPGLLARTTLFSSGIDSESARETHVRSCTKCHGANLGLPWSQLVPFSSWLSPVQGLYRDGTTKRESASLAFLEFDSENERYARIPALNFGEIGMVVIGLVTTHLPDGTRGFALLINISVIFDPMIQQKNSPARSAGGTQRGG